MTDQQDSAQPEPVALLPCPFCGHDDPYLERVGTARQSCIVECGMCGARHESSDEGARSGSSWNERAALAAHQPSQSDEAREALRELVAINDLKRSLAQANHHAARFPTDENYAVIDSLSTDIGRRQPLAWERARAALASQKEA